MQKPSTAVRLIKAAPIGRAFALRLWNRVERLRPKIVGTYFGAKIRCDARDIIQATITHFGVWEPDLSEIYQRHLQPGDVAVDVGANVGYFSLLFAKAVGPSGRVIAVEAHPELCGEIARNAEINSQTNIRIENVAVGEPGEITLFVAPNTNVGMSTIFPDRGYEPRYRVESVPLLSLLHDLQRISLIKCDIEGAELPVMREVLDNLDRFGPRLMVGVEASNTPEWKEIFHRFIAEGFTARQTPNDLNALWGSLLDDAPTVANPVNDLPENQADLIFTRGSAA